MGKIIKKFDKQLLFLVIVLFSLGLVMIYTSSNITAFYMYEANPGRYFFKQLFFIAISLVISSVLIKFNTRKYYKLSIYALVAISFAIFFLAFYGIANRGANNWFNLFGVGIQPSEFAKVFIIVFSACFYEKYKDQSDSKKIFIPLIVSIIITILIILQNDYGTALIFLCISVIMFFLSPACKKFKLYTFIAGIFAVISVVLLLVTGTVPKEKLERFNFSDPCSRYLTTGNQLCNGYIAINGGGVFGKGVGNSTQKYLYLPEAHTDFIFAILVEELGIVGGAFLIFLYFLLIVRLIRIGKKSSKVSYTMICYGVAIYIFLHIFINLGGVLGLIPLTGVPLPFLSYGGSFCMSLIFALTFVGRICYENSLQKTKVK